jgi:hypothetical protein
MSTCYERDVHRDVASLPDRYSALSIEDTSVVDECSLANGYVGIAEPNPGADAGFFHPKSIAFQKHPPDLYGYYRRGQKPVQN